MTHQSITIDSDLYENLRAYCDNSGIRFVDFVEDALEQAIAHEEILEKSEKADRVLNRVTEDMQRSFRRGFLRGYLAGVLAGQGRLALSQKLIPAEVSFPQDPYKIITGPQLKLFE
jgi:hypothetical protein